MAVNNENPHEQAARHPLNTILHRDRWKEAAVTIETAEAVRLDRGSSLGLSSGCDQAAWQLLRRKGTPG
jgi:hypothetical protein